MDLGESEVKSIPLILTNGTSAEAQLVITFDEDDLVQLMLTVEERQIEATQENLFMALREIRLQLEKESILLRCYGASRNVYPSPMILNMGYGDKAYRLKMGKPARMADLVEIFDDGPDVDPVTVTDQEEYYTRWIASIMNN